MKFKALRSLTWPSPDSMAMVKRAGGISKLSEEQRQKLVMKSCKAGDFCDGVPESSIKWLLKQGKIESVGPTKKNKVKDK
jgi:hypothetical protein|tara:strand:+ start:737 stop:976 length:240 start_codon:yes stop_codon:yes gene_type:complete